MTKLPHYDQVILDLAKLQNYCLDPIHPRGRHKARVFRDALSVGQADALWLRDVFLDAVRNGEAVELQTDSFGSRWSVDLPIARQGRAVVVRTIWIARTGERALRFVTCWVL